MKSLILSFFGIALLSFSFIKPNVPLQEKNLEITIAVAADFRYAMDSLIMLFKKNYPNSTIKPIYGSSGKFYEQILAGAPFDLFFSADLDYPKKLERQKLTASKIKIYGTGQLVLWSRNYDPGLNGMNTLLDPNIGKIAMANPALAPYGKRAEESLRYYKIYDKVKDKLVFGENIAQTAEYASTGAADIGIIALSLALNPLLNNQGKYFLIPSSAHQPLDQAYVILKRAENNPAAKIFSNFISSLLAKDILKKYGFSKS